LKGEPGEHRDEQYRGSPGEQLHEKQAAHERLARAGLPEIDLEQRHVGLAEPANDVPPHRRPGSEGERDGREEKSQIAGVHAESMIT
jgi:hypothetical protein